MKKCEDCGFSTNNSHSYANHRRYGCKHKPSELLRINKEKEERIKLHGKNGLKGKTFIMSEETKEKISKTKWGEKNPNWKGNDILHLDSARARARRRFTKKTKCELCKKIAIDIHHKDSNPLNNNKSNIMYLCRSCHMRIDGRLTKLVIMAQKANELKYVWSKSYDYCTKCGTNKKPHKACGLCVKCYSSKKYNTYKNRGWKWGVKNA